VRSPGRWQVLYAANMERALPISDAAPTHSRGGCAVTGSSAIVGPDGWLLTDEQIASNLMCGALSASLAPTALVGGSTFPPPGASADVCSRCVAPCTGLGFTPNPKRVPNRGRTPGSPPLFASPLVPSPVALFGVYGVPLVRTRW
jgi:hypothetical protein